MSLVYSVRRSGGREERGVLDDLFPAGVPDTGYTFEVRVNGAALAVDLREALGVEYALELGTGDLRLVEHHSERYSTTPNWLEEARTVLRDVDRGDEDQSAVRRRPRQQVTLGDEPRAAAEVTVERSDYRLVATVVTTPPLPEDALDALSTLQLGWEADVLGSQLVTALTVEDRRGPGDGVVRLELDEFSGTDDDVLRDPPAGYRDVSTERAEGSGDADAAAAGGTRLRVTSRETWPTMHGLRPEGQDLAAVFSRDLLDEATDAVNAVARCLSRFDGASDAELRRASSAEEFDDDAEAAAWRSERSHWLYVDWWSQLREHLDVFDREEAERAIQLLLLYASVADGRDLPTAAEHPDGLTDDEARTYERLLEAVGDTGCVLRGDGDPLELPAEACRVWRFVEAFAEGERRDRLAAAVAADVTRPFLLEPGPASTTLDVPPGPDAVEGIHEIRFSEMEYSVRLEHPDRLLHSVGIHDVPDLDTGVIHGVLSPESIRVNFRYATVPKRNRRSIACGIFTAGACWALTVNSGGGHGRLTDVDFAVDLRPSMTGGELRLNATLDEGASGLAFDFVTMGWNFTANSHEHTASLLNAMGDLLAGEFVDAAAEALDETLLRWPDVFNAVRGPRLHATAGDLRASGDTGALEADVSEFPTTGIATDVEHDRVSETGYAFSKRFLQAWLAAAAPPRSETAYRSAREFADEFGVDLGDPAELPDPEDADVPAEGHVDPPEGWGCRDPPSPPGPESRFRLRTERTGPTVELPPSGSGLDHAATIRFGYRFTIEAVRTWNYHVPIQVEEPCRAGAPGAFDGPLPYDERVARLLGATGPVDLSRAGRRNRERSWGAATRRATGRGAGGVGTPAGPGGVPGVPAGGGLPLPGADDGDGPVCPPPFCDWRLRETTRPIATYVDAEVGAESRIAVGFAPGGLQWLPQVTVGPVAEDDEYHLDVRVETLETSGPFDAVGDESIRTWLRDHARSETGAFLTAFDDELPPPTAELDVTVPDGADLVLSVEDGVNPAVVDWLRDVLVFAVGAEELRYASDGELAYWPFEVRQRLTEALGPREE